MAFMVPEVGRVTNGPMGSPPNAGQYGAFLIPSCDPGWLLALICDDGTEPAGPGEPPTAWEHVSVRALQGAKSRTPNWREMCHVKDTCWDAEDVVVQYHPAKSQYVDRHPHVLHLWRKIDGAFPMPPQNLV